MATTAILELQLKPDSLETAHTVIHATLTGTRAFAGCLDVTVLVDSDDPAHVIVYENWESIEHDRAYRAWRATPEGKSGLGPILAAPLKLTQFTVAEGVLSPSPEASWASAVPFADAGAISLMAAMEVAAAEGDEHGQGEQLADGKAGPAAADVVTEAAGGQELLDMPLVIGG